MNDQQAIWSQLMAPESRDMLYTVMRRAAGTLSPVTQLNFAVDMPWVERIPLSEITFQAGDPEIEMVGIYLRIEEGLQGHALLIVSYDNALNLVDRMIGQPPGTTTSLDALGSSALAEIGNLLISYFLNALVDTVGDQLVLRPSPPAVAVDMLGAILNTVVVPLAGWRDDLLVIGTTFRNVAATLQLRFWVLPDQKH